MQCVVKGSLPITVSWIKDDREVKEDENVKISFEDQIGKLHITNMQLKYDGKYTCLAKNEAGSQKCSASLIVKGLLQVLFNHLISYFVLSLYEYKLNCVCVGL